MSRYPVRQDGEWFHLRPQLRLACCDCGLVHTVDVRVHKASRAKASRTGYVRVGQRVPGVTVLMSAKRNMRATAQRRRKRDA